MDRQNKYIKLKGEQKYTSPCVQLIQLFSPSTLSHGKKTLNFSNSGNWFHAGVNFLNLASTHHKFKQTD